VCFRCYGNASVYGRRLCALWSPSFHTIWGMSIVSQGFCQLPASRSIRVTDNQTVERASKRPRVISFQRARARCEYNALNRIRRRYFAATALKMRRNSANVESGGKISRIRIRLTNIRFIKQNPLSRSVKPAETTRSVLFRCHFTRSL
jgi:hypothetical protein